MSDDTIPETKPPQRPVRFPEHLAVMLPRHMKADIVHAAEKSTQGDVVRRRLTYGRDLEEAYVAVPELEAHVERLRAESGTSMADALSKLLTFACREADRRRERNAKIAAELVVGMSEAGFEVDGVDVGDVSISID